jgi:hypothetical protein
MYAACAFRCTYRTVGPSAVCFNASTPQLNLATVTDATRYTREKRSCFSSTIPALPSRRLVIYVVC